MVGGVISIGSDCAIGVVDGKTMGGKVGFG